MYNFKKTEVKSDKRKRLKTLFSSLFFLFTMLYASPTYAQCAMCRAALESQSNTIQAEAVNDGIVYLMIIPYLLVAIAAYAVYKIKFEKKKEV